MRSNNCVGRFRVPIIGRTIAKQELPVSEQIVGNASDPVEADRNKILEAGGIRSCSQLSNSRRSFWRFDRVEGLTTLSATRVRGCRRPARTRGRRIHGLHHSEKAKENPTRQPSPAVEAKAGMGRSDNEDPKQGASPNTDQVKKKSSRPSPRRAEQRS